MLLYDFIWKDSKNRGYLLLGTAISLVLFIVFKLLYPFPDFFSDSYYYIYAAFAHLDVSIWPIGYSKFLALIHVFTYSDTALVAAQYFILQAALLRFAFVIRYVFAIQKTLWLVICCFLIINPLSLYLCNTITGDALFGAISILWISELILLLSSPKKHHIITQSVLLFLCFTIRNTAYYYPLVGALAFLLVKRDYFFKAVGIVLPLILIIPFVLHTRNVAFRMTGTKQFSLFTGWQLANNALYIYDKISVDSNSLPTPAAKELDKLSRLFISQVYDNDYRPSLENYVGNYFIRDNNAPLKIYFRTHYGDARKLAYIISWGKASVDFEPFGKYIIEHNPLAYAWYFVRPNIWHYLFPPLSHVGLYNDGVDKIQGIAVQWFHYKNNRVSCISHTAQSFLIFYSILFLCINASFLWEMGRYIVPMIRNLRSQPINPIFAVLLGFYVLNLGFSITTTVNILRYQFVPMVFFFAFSIVIYEHTTASSAAKSDASTKLKGAAVPSETAKVH